MAYRPVSDSTQPHKTQTQMKLTNPTDEQLNAAFALNVAGWRFNAPFDWYPPSYNSYCDPLDAPESFTQSADAVLPWLNAPGWLWAACNDEIYSKKPFMVFVHRGQAEAAASDTNFPRAAAIALLRAHGVEVEFTP